MPKYVCSIDMIQEGAKCIYDGVVDTEKHAYSVRKFNDRELYYHYADVVSSPKIMISVSKKGAVRLCSHLISLLEKGRDDTWVKEILRSCGYKVERITAGKKGGGNEVTVIYDG
jgi:hypothetical protein